MSKQSKASEFFKNCQEDFCEVIEQASAQGLYVQPSKKYSTLEVHFDDGSKIVIEQGATDGRVVE